MKYEYECCCGLVITIDLSNCDVDDFTYASQCPCCGSVVNSWDFKEVEGE